MRVLVVDPSTFSPQYDYHFCAALSGLGASVTLVGRPLREHERLQEGSFTFEALFYRRVGESEAGWRTSKLGRILKSFEHGGGLRELQRYANETEADVVHFQWLVLPMLDRLAVSRLRDRCRLFLTVHNAEVAVNSAEAVVGRAGSRLQSIGRTRAVLSFDGYIAHSEKTVERLLNLGVASNRIVHQQHPPLELRTSRPSPANRPSTDKANILFFGAIKPYKGVDVLVEAGLRLASSRRDFVITIAGRPFQPIEALRTRIAALGAQDLFHFDLGYIPDERLAEHISNSSVIVFPYRSIDGSGALSQALQFGKPIVASRVGGFAEPPFADHLELVPPEDPDALAATLAGLLDDPVRLRGLADRANALQRRLPTWSEYARACMRAYEGGSAREE